MCFLPAVSQSAATMFPPLSLPLHRMVSRFPIIHLRGTIPLVAPPRIIGYPVARHRITGFLVPNKVIYAGW